MDFWPRFTIDRVSLTNGKCLISYNRDMSLLIIHPEDIGSIIFVSYTDKPFIERRLGEKVMRLGVPFALSGQIKSLKTPVI